MARVAQRFVLLFITLVMALSLASCGDSGKKSFSTDSLKKFVEKQKKAGKMDYDKTKKAYKSVFPNMKMD